MRTKPSKRAAAFWASVALGLGAASMQELAVPDLVWIGTAIVAGLAGIYAAYLFSFGKESVIAGDGENITQNIHGDVVESTIIGKAEKVTIGRLTITAPTAEVQVDKTASFSNRPATAGDLARYAHKMEGWPGEPNYLTRTVLDVVAGYAAPYGLRVLVAGSKLAYAALEPVGSGSMRDRKMSITNTQAELSVGQPLAPRYNVDVYTSEPDEVQVEPVLG